MFKVLTRITCAVCGGSTKDPQQTTGDGVTPAWCFACSGAGYVEQWMDVATFVERAAEVVDSLRSSRLSQPVPPETTPQA